MFKRRAFALWFLGSGLLLVVLSLVFRSEPAPAVAPVSPTQAGFSPTSAPVTGVQAAPTIASAPALAAPSLPPEAPLRLLGPKTEQTARRATPVEDRWPQATALAERTSPHAGDPDLRHRVRIIRSDFKYPLLRVEETLRHDPATGTDSLVSQIAMVADHVLLKPAAGADKPALLASLTAAGGSIRSIKPAAGLYLVTISAPVDVAGLPRALDAFNALVGVVAYAEPDFVVHATLLPNDPSFAQLYGLHNTGQTGGAADADIDAPEAWDISVGSRSVLVGVIDTGIDHTHPDLAANMWTNPGEIAGNGIDDDGNGYIDDTRGWDFVNEDNNPADDHYHGTHCAGTIGAVGNNGGGVVGVAHEVSLVGLKFLSAAGGGTTSDAVEAVSYATGLGLDFTSNSWGGGGYSQALYDAIAAAGSAGHLFIAAAGNNASNTDTIANYPSGYALANIVSVAATDHADALASFSNYGATSVDLGAPGVNIYSTAPGNTYRTLSGTSMATPHVAGAAAVILAHAGALDPSALKAALLDHGDRVAALSGRTLTGRRLNLHASLSSVGPADPLTVSTAGATRFTGVFGGVLTPASVTFTLRNTGSAPLSWAASDDAAWLVLTPEAGDLAPGATATITATPNASAGSLSPATYAGSITFTNLTSGVVRARTVELQIEPLTEDILVEGFESGVLDTSRWVATGTSTFRTQVTSLNGPHGGTYHLTLDSSTDAAYARNEATFSIDLSGRSALRLVFWARIFSDEPNAPVTNPYTGGADFDGLAVSVDGSIWHEIQALRTPAAGDSWQQFTIDLDAAFAARGLVYGPAVRFRFNQYDNYPIATDGLAIDDIRIQRVYARALSLSLPASLAENATSASATLSANPAPTSDLVVDLVSSVGATLGVPASVVIPAGQTSATVALSIVDDALLNGARTASVTATAGGWATATGDVVIHDNESTPLNLTLPATAREGDTPVVGTLTAGTAPDTDLVISLFSDHPADASVPANVTLPAGQTSVSVPVTIVDDTRIDGTVAVAITATVAGWTPASASIAVSDNENTLLTLELPSVLREGQTGQSATLRLSGTAATSLIITLVSTDTTELTVPATVTIAAGQSSVAIPLTIISDSLTDGAQTFALEVSAPGFTSLSREITVADDDLHHFTLAPIPSPQVRGAPFSVTLTARAADDTVIPSFNAVLALSATDSSGGAVAVSPASATGGFVQGVWSGPGGIL